MTMDQLAAALPPPIPPGTKPAATPDAKAPPATDPTQGMPMAEAAPMVLPHTHPTAPQVALLQPAVPAPQVASPAPAPVVAPPVVAAPSPPPVAVAPLPAPALPGFAAAAAAPAPSFAPAPPPGASVAMMSLPPPKPVQSTKPVHHWARHPVPAAQAQPWLADANGNPAEKPRHPHRHAAPEAPAAQFYAANEPSRLPDPTPRITPPAATVMYSPSSGSALGMAASAALAPPRPLYSTAQ
jgi:Meckel syndrome type 1 protein